MINYDAIIMVTLEKIPLLKNSYSFLKKNLGAQEIYLVANRSLEREIRNVFGEKMHFIDEESIMPGLSLQTIREILLQKCGDDHRAGWFYQQFLKMAYALICEKEYYLLWDADTVPLHKINYFENGNTPCFVVKKEYYKDYFDTIETLFNGKVSRLNPEISYIAENMLICSKYMKKMIAEIMGNFTVEGNTFYEKIVNAINPRVVSYTGFSEFETYGNYMDTLYPGIYAHKKLRTQRLGSFLFGTNPSEEQLCWAGADYDIISFEEHGKQWLKYVTKSRMIRKYFDAKRMFDSFIRISNRYDRICHRPVAEID